MSRLTNGVREAITASAVAHAFEPKLEALKTEADALAREAYALLFTEDEIAKVRAVPDHWFRLDECLRFNAGGYQVRLSLIGGGLPVPYRTRDSDYGGYHCGVLGSVPHGDLCDRLRAHADAEEAYKAERRKAYHSVTAMLSAVTTVKRLREAWPEGEQFYAPYEGETATTLPAVRVDEVNAALGLSLAA